LFCFRSWPSYLELGGGGGAASGGDLVVKEPGLRCQYSYEAWNLRGQGYSRSQEVGIVFSSDLTSEVLSSKLELVALGGLGLELGGLLLEELESVSLVDTLALGGGDAVADPLPELRARDLSGSRILPIRRTTRSMTLFGYARSIG